MKSELPGSTRPFAGHTSRGEWCASHLLAAAGVPPMTRRLTGAIHPPTLASQPHGGAIRSALIHDEVKVALTGELLAMDDLDRLVLIFFNQFVRWSPTLDAFIILLSRNDLLKGGLFLTVMWGLWFTEGVQAEVRRTRATLLATLAGTFGALMAARALALALPLRLRPLHNSLLALQLAAELSPRTLEGWSAFPSDHAALFAGLAMGLYLVSRRLGVVGGVYALLVIYFPRLYLSLHYPTDILGGALLGVISSLVAYRLLASHVLMCRVLTWQQTHRAAFYSLFFLGSYEIATLFAGVRALGSFAVTMGKALLHQDV